MNDTLFIEIQGLCRIAHQRGLHELSLSQPSFSISLKTAPVNFMASIPGALAPTANASNVQAEIPSGYAICSPLVGIFYRASSPDVPAFVEIGDTVEIGQTVGVVEAMKVFNEIIADAPGIVTAIPADNGSLVQVDQPLVILHPLE